MADRRKETVMERAVIRERHTAAHEGHAPYAGHVVSGRANRKQFSPHQQAKGYSPANWKTFNP